MNRPSVAEWELEGAAGSYARVARFHVLPALVLHDIYVPDLARGQGYGRALLIRAIAVADEAGLPLMLAPVQTRFCPIDLEAWYTRHGFVVTPSGAMMERPCPR